MPTETETLLLAVLSQLPTQKLRYDLLATSIGSPTPAAARMRWQRFQKKLRDSAAQQTPTVGQTSPSPPAGRKSTNGQRVGQKPVGVVKASVGGVKSGHANGNMHEETADGDEETEARTVPNTTPERAIQLVSPPRRCPPRQARCKVFKDDSPSEEEEEEGEEEATDQEQLEEAVVKEEVQEEKAGVQPTGVTRDLGPCYDNDTEIEGEDV